MIDYLVGETYRLLHKKSIYLYFGALAALYLLLVFVRSGGGDGAAQISQDAETLFAFLPALVGGYLFATFYIDDLNAKNLATLIGFGMGKAKIALSKLLLTALSGALVFALVPLFMWAAYSLMWDKIPAPVLGSLYAWAAKPFLETVAFSAVSAIAVYGLQRATFGMAAYLLLSLGIVSGLLSALLDWEMVSSVLPGVSGHLMSGISLRVLVGLFGKGPLAEPLAEYAVYVAVAAALSVFAFRRKELEF